MGDLEFGKTGTSGVSAWRSQGLSSSPRINAQRQPLPGSRDWNMAAKMPLIPAIRPSPVTSKPADRPINPPPASAVQGVNCSQSMLM